MGRRPDLLTRLKARDYEPSLQTSAVDQLLGGEARARPQVGEVALAALNLIIFGAFTFATARVLRAEDDVIVPASPS